MWGESEQLFVHQTGEGGEGGWLVVGVGGLCERPGGSNNLVGMADILINGAKV